MTKNGSLKLFTKTWPIKREKKAHVENGRPLTATLDRPTVLDIRFMAKIDMSLVRKEFLNITNLCRLPLNIKRNNHIRSFSLANNIDKKKAKKIDNYSDSHEDDESSIIQSAKINRFRYKNQDRPMAPSSLRSPKRNGTVATLKDANNNKVLKAPIRKLNMASSNLNTVANLSLPPDLKIASSTKLPEPCRSCGRPDQPERFHSHPATPATPLRKQNDVCGTAHVNQNQHLFVKSTVQKPVAIRYKSKHATKPVSAIKKSASHQVGRTKSENMSKAGAARVPSGKRTLTCYICRREFGTASLPLHEPKCLQRWERENSKLPRNLQRKAPIKPDGATSQKEWNELAWESSQATLVPCKNCRRTFYPDRLAVHQRSCKVQQVTKKGSANESSSPTSSTISQSSADAKSLHHLSSVKCYICGKMFGSHSIKMHEKKCLKKWHDENESLPPDVRGTPPLRNDQKGECNFAAQTAILSNVGEARKENKDERPASAKKLPLFPCYLCGKLFTVHSIYLHEPQCLKLWKIENEKLPLSKRRPQPLKPDIKFTPSGKINFEETTDAYWRTHLSQLVPCRMCSRTFNPDRVTIHEKSCKGN